MAEDIRIMQDTTGVAAFHGTFEKPYCVLLDSEYCSMGRMIAYKACENTPYRYYDAVMLLEKLNDPTITTSLMEQCENKLRKEDLSRKTMLQDAQFVHLADGFARAVRMVLAEGPCLIHDRAVPEEIRAMGYSVFTVLNYATSLPSKIERAKRSPACADCKSEADYIARIREEDRIRANWHRAHSDTTWGDKSAYDLCLNAETLGHDYASELLHTILIR